MDGGGGSASQEPDTLFCFGIRLLRHLNSIRTVSFIYNSRGGANAPPQFAREVHTIRLGWLVFGWRGFVSQSVILLAIMSEIYSLCRKQTFFRSEDEAAFRSYIPSKVSKRSKPGKLVD